MKVSAAIAPTLACSALLGVQCLAQTQTPTPPAQPAYPSAPVPRNRVNPPAEEPARKPTEPGCASLKGLEKAECERRDNTDDDAPAGVTSSMREKQKEAAKENVDTSTDSAADTAKKKPAAASSSSDTKPKVDEERTQTEKPNTGADEADTLGKPPA